MCVNIFKWFLGPDICGPGTKKVHVIFNYKGKNLLINKDIRCKDDIYTHLYTLIIKPDNTYEVNINSITIFKSFKYYFIGTFVKHGLPLKKDRNLTIFFLLQQ